MKKLRLKDNVKDVIGIILFFILIIVGTILINQRLEYINNINEVSR